MTAIYSAPIVQKPDIEASRVLSVIIPVYYNQETLPELYEELKKFETELHSRNVGMELIMINDGSGDDSLLELKKIKQVRPATKVISFTKNFGAIAASKAGFRVAAGDAFIVVSADLQDPISHVLTMVDHWLAGSKFVIAVREARDDPLLTKMFSYMYYKIVRWLVIKDYPRGGFDLMLATNAVLPYLNSQGRNVNPNVFAYALGYRPTVISYKRIRRRHGKSRWTFRKKVNHFVNTLTGFSVAPIRLISGFGAIVALLGFLYGFWLAVGALIIGVAVPGFTTLAVLISFFSGLVLLMLGIVGEYLWRIFDAVSSRPESVIDEAFL